MTSQSPCCIAAVLAAMVIWTGAMQITTVQNSKEIERMKSFLCHNNQIKSIQRGNRCIPCHCACQPVDCTNGNEETIGPTTYIPKGPAPLPSTVTETKLTYIRWGKQGCDGRHSTFLLKGFAIGLSGHQSVTNGLQCVEDKDVETEESQHAITYGPKVSAVKLNLMGVRPKPSVDVWNTVDQKIIPCAICEIAASDILIKYGANQCSSDWRDLYYGYMMADFNDALSESSSPICVDKTPDAIGSPLPGNTTPKFGFASKDGKIVTCVVCARTK